jgi:glyoxylase-like metal-dependent hydrolase (beta-lactamase superfamily II)
VEARALDPGVVVLRSAFWQTTATIVHRAAEGDDGPGECFVIDSPVFPHELEALALFLEQSGWTLSGLLCTHGDWDHLLGRFAFPDASLGCAETTAARLRAHPGEAQRDLRAFDEENYVERPRPLALGQVQALPVPGHVEIGDVEIEVLPTEGHTADGMALRLPWAGVVVCGDYLSPVEIPWLSETGSRDAYLATLERLRPWVEEAEYVVPGHGGAIGAQQALAILREDVAYLQSLPDPETPLPMARRAGAQKKIHEENLGRVSA